MRILTVHNYPGHYAFGGEGQVFEDEARLLKDHGHEVAQVRCTNSEFMEAGLLTRIRAFRDAPWSQYGYRLVRDRIAEFGPDIMHVHNFFFILSPAVFRAAKDAGVPTVATLHNYRLLSPCSQLLRRGRICEMCVGGNPWRIMLYRCYRKSFLANFLRYRVYYLGRRKYGWSNDIDSFIALTEFAKQKFITGGLPRERIYVKPNCMDDPLDGRDDRAALGRGGVFVGRLSPEKGLATLMRAWSKIDYPLRIVGDGPQRDSVMRAAPDSVEFLGSQPRDAVMQALRDSAFVVMPSEWYEGFPLSVLEAMATGRAVVTTDLGARREMVRDGETGLLFRAGDAQDLQEKVQRLIAEPTLCAEMG